MGERRTNCCRAETTKLLLKTLKQPKEFCGFLLYILYRAPGEAFCGWRQQFNARMHQANHSSGIWFFTYANRLWFAKRNRAASDPSDPSDLSAPRHAMSQSNSHVTKQTNWERLHRSLWFPRRLQIKSHYEHLLQVPLIRQVQHNAQPTTHTRTQPWLKAGKCMSTEYLTLLSCLNFVWAQARSLSGVMALALSWTDKRSCFPHKKKKQKKTRAYARPRDTLSNRHTY